MTKSTLLLLLCLFCGPLLKGQEIEKIKNKHFLGSWYSRENVMEAKDQSVLVFYRNPPKELKDSIRTTFNIRKDDVKIYFYAAGKADTAKTLWAFVKDSRNLKVTIPISTGQTVYYNEQNIGRGTGSLTPVAHVYLLFTATFHVESITEDKMVLRHIILNKK